MVRAVRLLWNCFSRYVGCVGVFGQGEGMGRCKRLNGGHGKEEKRHIFLLLGSNICLNSIIDL